MDVSVLRAIATLNSYWRITRARRDPEELELEIGLAHDS